MKHRLGFVSNSSSSSFILLGVKDRNLNMKAILKNYFKVKDEDILKKCKKDWEPNVKSIEDVPEDFYYEYYYDCVDRKNSKVKYYSEEDLLGLSIEEGSDDNLDSGSLSLEELEKMIVEVKELVKDSKEPVKLYYGQYSC